MSSLLNVTILSEFRESPTNCQRPGGDTPNQHELLLYAFGNIL